MLVSLKLIANSAANHVLDMEKGLETMLWRQPKAILVREMKENDYIDNVVKV